MVNKSNVPKKYARFVVWMCLFETILFLIITVMVLVEIIPDMSGGPVFLNIVHVMAPLGWIIFFGIVIIKDAILLIIHIIQVLRKRLIEAEAKRGHKKTHHSNNMHVWSDLLFHHNLSLLVYNITLPRILFFAVVLPVFITGTPVTRFYEYLSIYVPLHLPFMFHLAFLLPHLTKYI